MKQPLIMLHGLLQAAEGERLQILRVNFGFAEPILVSSKTIIVWQTRHILVKNGEKKVNKIMGGEEGDLLLLQGNVKLITGNNISKKTTLKADKITSLLFTGGLWIPC